MSEPLIVSFLQETWVKVHGIPDKLCVVPTMKDLLKIDGKAVVVDESTLSIKGVAVHTKLWCWDPTKVRGRFEMFWGISGFIIRIHPEGGAPLLPASPIPHAPPDDEHDDDEPTKPNHYIRVRRGWFQEKAE